MTRFSRLISGVMTWGDWGKNLRVPEQTSLLENLFEQGITTFDHADIYGHYTSEALFGKAFEASQIERDQIQLISKCCLLYTSPSPRDRQKSRMPSSA